MTVTLAGREDRRAIAIVAWVAAAIGLASSVLWDATRYVDGRFIAQTADLVTIGAEKARLFRVALLADMLGSYLLFLPIAVYLRRDATTATTAATARASRADLAAVGGIGYAIVGGVGAAAFASAGAPLIRAYAAASAGDAVHIATVFRSLADAVAGTWQIVAGTLGGLWWISLGVVLRSRWRWFSRFTLLFGAIAVLTAAGRMVGLDYESTAPATPAFLSIAVWPAWLGALLWREE